uniref:Methyltransferase n=1 Tax=Gibberella zeae TaxID=5518 RepID=A0A4E9EH21_GIBZA
MDHEEIYRTYYDGAITYRNDDNVNDDNVDDETYSGLDTVSTTSLETEAGNFQQLFNRQYHNEGMGNRWEPIDELRQDMWDMLEFADKYPDATVEGIDISPIMPSWVPPNLKFCVSDFGQDGSFKESSFDYIHARDLNGSVDRCKFAKDVFTVLAPGGVAEFHEGPIEFQSIKPLAKGSYMDQWGGFFRAVNEKRRRSFLVTNDGTLRQAMAAAGFEDITVHEYKIPIGPWGKSKKDKTVGQLALEALTLDTVGSILRLAIEDLGWSEEWTYVFATRVRNEIFMYSEYNNVYMLRTVVVGKKPK